MHKLIWVVAHAIRYKISCTDTYIHVDKWYTLQVYLRRRTRLYTYSCSASAQKAELNVVGALGVEDLGMVRGKCASLYTGGSVWDGLVEVWGVSVDTTILHTFLSAPACTACTDMVYSKELERDVTTTAMAKVILCLKTLAFIPSSNMIGSIFLCSKDE